jgi:hypothetical protein
MGRPIIYRSRTVLYFDTGDYSCTRVLARLTLTCVGDRPSAVAVEVLCLMSVQCQALHEEDQAPRCVEHTTEPDKLD